MSAKAIFKQTTQPFMQEETRRRMNMKTATFYHAGCPVCVQAEETIASALDKNEFDVEIVHLGDARDRIEEAESLGVVSVPAIVINGRPFHINYGASIEDVKG